MVQYGLNIINQNAIIDKAATKKDGIYSFRGVVYRVVGGKVTHYASGGKVVQGFGHFNVDVGSYDGYESAARKLLKNI
jgi:hypothetical protein